MRVIIRPSEIELESLLQEMSEMYERTVPAPVAFWLAVVGSSASLAAIVWGALKVWALLSQ